MAYGAVGRRSLWIGTGYIRLSTGGFITSTITRRSEDMRAVSVSRKPELADEIGYPSHSDKPLLRGFRSKCTRTTLIIPYIAIFAEVIFTNKTFAVAMA